MKKRREINTRIDKLGSKLDNTDGKMGRLQETNKYFYRMTSPSPFQISQQQYLLKVLEKKGCNLVNKAEIQS